MTIGAERARLLSVLEARAEQLTWMAAERHSSSDLAALLRCERAENAVLRGRVADWHFVWKQMLAADIERDLARARNNDVRTVFEMLVLAALVWLAWNK